MKDKFKSDELLFFFIEGLKKLYTVAKTALTDKEHLLFKLLKGSQTIDVKGFPTETNIESVEWYLLSINPFLNYKFTSPGEFNFLMLDWEKDENVVFDTSSKRYRYAWGFSTDEVEAKSSLTDLQMKLVMKFAEAPGNSKIIGVHAPPIGPWADWYDDE